MNKAKEIFVLILGGLGWIFYAIALMLGGALGNSTGVWLFVVALGLGICMVYFGIDKIMGRPRRW